GSRTIASAASNARRTATMRAPKAVACTSVPTATYPAGRTTVHGNAARAAYAAALAAVLPVEAHSTARDPVSTAFATATTIPRSLNDPVGFAPSHLSQ